MLGQLFRHDGRYWLRNEENVLNEQLQKIGEFDPAVGRAALAVFDFVQNAAARWESSNKAVRREILGTVLLKRTLSDVNLCVEKRKPFDLMAEGLFLCRDETYVAQ